MHRHILALASLALSGCGDQADPPAPAVAPSNAPIPIPTTTPAEAPYTILSDGEEGPTRRLVDIKLNKKVTPEALREIAMEVKSRDGHPHERTVIYYHLPADFPELDGEPWASTHFKPTLEVAIMGLSLEEEAALRKLPLDHEGQQIGAWLLDNQYKTLDLIYDDGSPKIAEIRSPQDRVVSELIELTSPAGRRFQKVQGTNLYDIDPEGNLRISNAEGRILSAAKPIR